MRYVIVLVFLCTSLLGAKPLEWKKNIEYVLGFYDMGLTTSLVVYDLSYVLWQPFTIRWNPFVGVFSFETTVRYFPFQHLQRTKSFFSEKGLMPYSFLGMKVPHTFQALGTPLGIGALYRWNHFSLHGRVYADLGVVPVLQAGWSFELAVDWYW